MTAKKNHAESPSLEGGISEPVLNEVSSSRAEYRPYSLDDACEPSDEAINYLSKELYVVQRDPVHSYARSSYAVPKNPFSESEKKFLNEFVYKVVLCYQSQYHLQNDICLPMIVFQTNWPFLGDFNYYQIPTKTPVCLRRWMMIYLRRTHQNVYPSHETTVVEKSNVLGIDGIRYMESLGTTLLRGENLIKFIDIPNSEAARLVNSYNERMKVIA